MIPIFFCCAPKIIVNFSFQQIKKIEPIFFSVRFVFNIYHSARNTEKNRKAAKQKYRKKCARSKVVSDGLIKMYSNFYKYVSHAKTENRQKDAKKTERKVKM